MRKQLFTTAGVCLAVLGAGVLCHHVSRAGSRNSAATRGGDAAIRLRALEAYAKIPLTFEANSGQTDARVKFLARGAGYTVFLTDRDATLRLQQTSTKANPAAPATDTVVRLALAGANSHPVAHAIDQQPGHANYFVGNDPRKWRSNVPEYARVKFDAVYPGIDLVYYGSQGRLESDYVVSPGADPNRIALRVEGADHIRMNSDGDAILSTVAGDVSLHQPRAYQQNDAGRTEVAANYVQLGSGALGIRVGAYNSKLPLVIDPVVGYATLLSGSTSATAATAIAIDSVNNAYIVGVTGAADFPTTAGAYQPARTNTAGNAFVTKLNSAGSSLIFSTYLGGSGSSGKIDTATGVAVDSSGNVYITGATPSSDFPINTSNAYQVVNNGAPLNGFLTELNPTGSTLLYSTYLGGSGSDACAAIALDSNGNAYVTGTATSTAFPVTPGMAIQTAGQSSGLAFISRFNTTLSGTGSLVYSTLLGGTSSNQGTGIAVDSSFNAYITGQTTSTDFPVAGAFQSALKGTAGNAFVAEVDTTTAHHLVYATYLGGTATSGSGDIGTAIAVPQSSSVFVTGNTNTTDFPVTAGVFQTALKNTTKTTFVARFDTTKSGAPSMVYSTFLGGSTQDAAAAIAADSSGNAYVGGATQSSDFPVTPGAPQFTRTTQTGDIGYVSVLNSTGTALTFSTYFGGSTSDGVTGVSLDGVVPPNIHIAGLTASSDFPVTTGAFQTTFKTGAAFVARLTPGLATGVILSPSTLNFGKQAVGVTSQPFIVTLANLTSNPVTVSKISFLGPDGADFTETSTTCTTVAVGATCSISVTFTPSITGTETSTMSVMDSDSSSPQTIQVTGTGVTAALVFLSPATVDFGTQGVNKTSTAQTVTLKNNSTATLINIVVSITGTGASSFGQTSACGLTLAAGKTCTISVTFTPTATGPVNATLSVADSDASSPQTATLTGTGTTTTPDFSVAASPASVSVAAGGTASTTVTVTGLNGFTSAVALSCSGAPAGSSCSLNPSSVTPTATGVTSSAAIVTTARTAPAMAYRIDSRPTTGIWNAALAIAALSLILFVWIVRQVGTARKLAWTFGVLLTLSLTSCSGLPATGTPAGTYTITITGTSGTLTHSTTVSLTVS